MKTIEINLYSFSELSEEAKQKAIDKWYESEDYPFLETDLTESLKSLLEENKVQFNDINILYSLGYSQGDGLCFTGELIKDGKKLILKHSGRYYYAESVDMEFYDIETGEEIEEAEELKDIYFDVCEKIEKEGYSMLEYRMDFNEFDELCEANEYTFLEDGTMRNE